MGAGRGVRSSHFSAPAQPGCPSQEGSPEASRTLRSQNCLPVTSSVGALSRGSQFIRG